MTSGQARTTLIFVSTRGADRVYTSIDEVPAGLRARLYRSIGSENAVTLLITDEEGRAHIQRILETAPTQKRGWRPSGRLTIGLALAGATAFVLWAIAMLR